MAETHAHALPTGSRIEEYEIVRVLGAGGFGITYLAFDHKLDGPVALKEYFPHGHAARADDGVAATSTTSRELFAWGLARFLDEARSIHRFRHPNVVRVHRYLETDGTAYIVMEHVEGEPLETILEARAPLPAAEWRRWLDRLLGGLAHVHGYGYVHRDIKPGNIIVRSADGEPVLIDFGAARTAAQDRIHTQVLTPPYAPLEQHGSEGPQGPPVDIYALAAVSYRALTGTLPPPAPARAVNDSYEPLAGWVAGAELPWLAAIDRGLALRPDDRPQTVAAWRAAWRGADEAAGAAPGVSVTNLSGEAGAVLESMARRTFVGIDFGTSTTVVSIVRLDRETRMPVAEPLPIAQFDEDETRIDDHLVPSALAWHNDRLLVGRGVSPHLKPALREGINLWTSFKMQLGVDLGPQYPNTALAKGRGPVVIERPQDAATLFFEYVRKGVERHISDNKLPPPAYAVSVPAAFEANQRRDLVRALDAAGIPVEDAGLIDEPNAAFLSHLLGMERGTRGPSVSRSLEQRARRVLVFDFGAGTCDISAIEFNVANGRLSSRNLAISKFLALGGDDIDRAIAQEILLPQLRGDTAPDDTLSSSELDKALLPWLKPTAEELKIQCCKRIEKEEIRDPRDLQRYTEPFSVGGIEPIRLRDAQWTLDAPQISLRQFAEIMQPFLAGEPPGDDDGDGPARSVLGPVTSALEKARIAPDDLDMVLFIGGSSANLLVQGAIEDYLGRFVEAVKPRDLRSHVSQGAALHSLYFHGLEQDLISPITSEPIYVVTRNDTLEPVLDAGSPVPSPATITTLTVDRDRQPRVELPFCVSGRDKLLAVVAVQPPSPPGHFEAGQTVRVSCHVSRDKLLAVKVYFGDAAVTSDILNPLANAELPTRGRRLLQARQALNESILAGHGRPSTRAVLTYARAAEKAQRWREAAEMYEAAERLDPESDHAVNIAFNYWNAGNHRRSAEWSIRAHERAPSCTTAYNCALDKQHGGDADGYARLMEESLRVEPDYVPALTIYGHTLHDDGDPRRLEYIERAFAILKAQLESRTLSASDCRLLERNAVTLGRQRIRVAVREYRRTLAVDDSPIREEFLAAGPSRGGTAAGKELDA